MSVYLPADLRRQVREHFANCCAYCRTAEELTVVIFEFEHITGRATIPALRMNRPQLIRVGRHVGGNGRTPARRVT